MATTPYNPTPFYSSQKADFTKPVDLGNLKEKSVIVTGGANGIGAASTIAFAEAGAYVSILDLNEEKGNTLTESLKGKGYNVQFIKTDVTSWDSQLAAFKSAIAFSPSKTLDIVVTSAGLTTNHMTPWFLQVSASPDKDPEPPNKIVIDVNLTGTFYSAHLALHYFKQTLKPGDKSSKQLIVVSSLAGYVSISNTPDYSSSKHGVRGLWQSLRCSTKILGPDAPIFRTNLIAPSWINTGMINGILDFIKHKGMDLAEVEDAAAGIIRIAADEDIVGRAICTTNRDKVPGDKNFDLCDDWEGQLAGRETMARIKDGSIKELHVVENDFLDGPFCGGPSVFEELFGKRGQKL